MYIYEQSLRGMIKAAKDRDFPHLFSSRSQTSQDILKEFESRNVLQHPNKNGQIN